MGVADQPYMPFSRWSCYTHEWTFFRSCDIWVMTAVQYLLRYLMVSDNGAAILMARSDTWACWFAYCHIAELMWLAIDLLSTWPVVGAIIMRMSHTIVPCNWLLLITHMDVYVCMERLFNLCASCYKSYVIMLCWYSLSVTGSKWLSMHLFIIYA